ncbi:MAG: polymerase subunit sigma-24 [Sphingobacteriaceae bacterium]|jgi:RNA polymerase sigma-70 factor (ECF subfamily)|nr:polymerase subunit sigma-24 [Sphingobacteriaceae bacterium]
MKFEEIYQQYAPGVFRLCMGYVNNHEQARDLTQDTFIAVWKYLPSFRNESKLSTWIYRIASNNCFTAVEKAKRFVLTDFPENLAFEPDSSKEQQLQFLYKCISELPETERIIISLVLEDVHQEEIASIVGLSYVNTRMKIHRIKEKLAKKFKNNGSF